MECGCEQGWIIIPVLKYVRKRMNEAPEPRLEPLGVARCLWCNPPNSEGDGPSDWSLSPASAWYERLKIGLEARWHPAWSRAQIEEWKEKLWAAVATEAHEEAIWIERTGKKRWGICWPEDRFPATSELKRRGIWPPEGTFGKTPLLPKLSLPSRRIP